jgi:hypothetical protein
MSEQRTLQPGVPVSTADVTLFSSSLHAQVTVSTPGELTGGTRGAGTPDLGFENLLRTTGMQEQLTVVLDDVEHLPPAVPADGRGPGDDLQMEVPAPIPGVGQVVLDVGVDKLWTWHVGEDLGGDDPGRAGGTRRYRLPSDTGRRTTIESDGASENRGLIGQLGRRVVKVLLFRVLEIGGAWAAEKMARRWEDDNRPHRLRRVTAGDLGDPLSGVPSLTSSELRALIDNQHCLLLIHGTASRTDSCFGSMPVEVAKALFSRYEGRVLAFDHPTISYDPVENVTWLARQLPFDISPTIDVVSHSRGGLVTRLAFERNDLGLNSSWFNTAVLVASPNMGTELASPAKLGRLLEALANIVGLAPTNPVTDVLEVVLTVVKHLAVGALGGLDGLASMDPAMTWTTAQLPNPTPVLGRYRAIGSDYQPAEGAPLSRLLRNFTTDAIFVNKGNDLVVPTNGTDLDQRIIASLRIPRTSGVDHSGFWTRIDAMDKLGEWLSTAAHP